MRLSTSTCWPREQSADHFLSYQIASMERGSHASCSAPGPARCPAARPDNAYCSGVRDSSDNGRSNSSTRNNGLGARGIRSIAPNKTRLPDNEVENRRGGCPNFFFFFLVVVFFFNRVNDVTSQWRWMESILFCFRWVRRGPVNELGLWKARRGRSGRGTDGGGLTSAHTR